MKAYLYVGQVFSEFWIFLHTYRICMASNVSACDDLVTIDTGNEQYMSHIETEVLLFTCFKNRIQKCSGFNVKTSYFDL